MVEVFATSVHRQEQARAVLDALELHFPLCRSNFDLEDCDRILRVEGAEIIPDRIIGVLMAHGFDCKTLD